MKKVYIAGKIKGLPIAETELKFFVAQTKIEFNGDRAVNPFDHIKTYNQHIASYGGQALSDDDPQQRKEIMRICTGLLMDCDSIFLCEDWQQSEGAKFEKQVADFFNIPVYR